MIHRLLLIKVTTMNSNEGAGDRVTRTIIEVFLLRVVAINS